MTPTGEENGRVREKQAMIFDKKFSSFSTKNRPSPALWRPLRIFSW